MVQLEAALEFAGGVLLGVAAMLGRQFQDLPVPLGDGDLIAVIDEDGDLGIGHRLPPG